MVQSRARKGYFGSNSLVWKSIKAQRINRPKLRYQLGISALFEKFTSSSEISGAARCCIRT